MCHDFDHLDDIAATKRLLLADTEFETLLLFTSPSGQGLKWVIETDLSKATHIEWFNAVSNYLRATYGLQSDPACKNVSRACFIPYDPDAYIAPRMLPEVQTLADKNPAVLDLMNQFCVTNIQKTTL